MTQKTINESSSTRCYTPGPWDGGSCGFEGNEPYMNVYGAEPSGAIICGVLSEEVGAAEAVANANLICAAPQLLEALKRLVEWDVATWDADIANAREVIQQATQHGWAVGVRGVDRVDEVSAITLAAG